jgi:tetratricopeptide (TPR) repeat protein
MRVLRYWRIGLGAAVALSVGVALAADPPPVYPECTKKASPQENEAAKNAHKVATLSYEQGNYDKAIRYWTDAYGFDCTVNELLINIANAYEKKGDRAGAVATLEAYLKRTGPNNNIEEKVKNLKASMAPPTPTVTVPTAAPTVTTAPTATVAPTSTAPIAPPEGPRPHGSSPWFVVGGGSALVIVGAILLPIGSSAVSSAQTQCGAGHNGCPNQTIADQGTAGQHEVQAGGALLGIGLAAAAGGLVWQFAFNKPGPAKPAPTTGQPQRSLTGHDGRSARRSAELYPQTPGMWVKPIGGPGQSGVVVGGAF